MLLIWKYYLSFLETWKPETPWLTHVLLLLSGVIVLIIIINILMLCVYLSSVAVIHEGG